MKRKKITALCLSVAMAIGLLAGCGSSDGEKDEGNTTISQSGGEENQKDANVNDGEVYNIAMQIVTWGSVPDEVADVENAINKITEPEIGVTVTLNPIAAWDLINESNLALTSGEKVDLLCIFAFGQSMDSIANYTSKNMLRPLNELYETYGKDIEPILGEEINLGYIGNTLYAIPSKASLGIHRGSKGR